MPLWRSASAKAKLLQGIPLFEGLSPRQLGQIARLAEEVEVAANKRLTVAGETGRELFVILEGSALVKTPQGRTEHLGAGQFFREMSLIDGGPRSATGGGSPPLHLLGTGHPESWAFLAGAPVTS